MRIAKYFERHSRLNEQIGRRQKGTLIQPKPRRVVVYVKERDDERDDGQTDWLKPHIFLPPPSRKQTGKSDLHGLCYDSRCRSSRKILLSLCKEAVAVVVL
jgi:hypothetical protein